MARVYTLGLMAVATTACGKMVDSMGKESTFRVRDRSAKVSGTMEGAKNGLMKHSNERNSFILKRIMYITQSDPYFLKNR